MDLRQLGYVVAVVDHAGFTAAAAALHVAQPSLSQAVRALEAELGVELFDRHTRPVRLTSAGQALLEPARQALRDVATARAAVAEVAGLEAGHLDLVCLPTLAVDPAASLIGRFRHQHPGITVRLVEPEDADAVAHRVRTGDSEVGFTELPLATDDLVTHLLAHQEYVALFPSAHGRGLRPGRTVGVDELADQPLVTTPPGTSTRRQLDTTLAAAGLTATIAVETDHREALAPLVVAGAGVALVPREVTATLPGDAPVDIRSIRPAVIRQVGLIHRPGPLSPAAHAFLSIALPDPAGATRSASASPR